MKRKKASTRFRALSLTTVMGLGLGLVCVANGPASADTPINVGPLHYKCAFPLIGSQPLDVTVSSTLPDFKTGGSYSLPITAVSTVNAASASGMWAAKAYTIEGSGSATAKLYSPEFPNGKDVSTDITVDQKAITGPKTPAAGANVEFPPPEPTSAFDINAHGNSPSVTVTQAGWGQINVENLKLKITPKDSNGNPTSLGTFDSDCWLTPGQSNVLGQAWIDDGSTPQTPKPAPVNTSTEQGEEAADGSGLPVVTSTNTSPLLFTCNFPGLGVNTVAVDMSVDYPTTIPTNTRARPLSIKVTTHISQALATGIATLGAKYIDGVAISNNTMKTPDFGDVRAQTAAALQQGTVPDLDDNGEGKPFDILGTANAPGLVYQKAGTGSIVVGDVPPAATNKPDLILSMALTDADHNPIAGPAAKFRRNCFLTADSIGKTLNSWTVTAAPVQAPGPVTGAAGTAEETTAKITWNAPTTGGKATSYEVTAPGVDTYTGSATTANFTGLTPDKDYTFSIVAKNGGGSSTPVTTTVHTKKPADPVPGAVTNLAADAKPTSIDLTWDAPSGPVTGYQVVKGAEDPITVTEKKATFNNLTPDTDYTFKVSAVNGAAVGPAATKTVHTPKAPAAPATPANFKAAVDGTSVVLTWDASTGATGYDVTKDGGPATGVTGTTFTFTGLAAGQHTFTVAAKNDVGASAAATATATIAEAPKAPDQVTNLKATPSDTTLALTWNPADRATSYDVSLNGGAAVNVPASATPSKTFDNLTPKTKYTFSVVAKNDVGSAPATTGEATTLEAPKNPPAAVTELKGTTTTDSATLTWKPSVGATSYDVSKDGGAPVNTTAATSTFTGLTPATEYTFKVVAKNADGDSPATTVKLTTAAVPVVPLAAPVVKADDAGSFTPTLTWAAVDRATGYQVFRDGVQVGSPTGTSFTSAKLAYGGTYKFTVKAVNAKPAETSLASNEIAVTPKDATAPSAPVLSLGTVSATSVALSWTASTDADAGIAGYDVYKDGVKVTTALVTGTTYTASGLNPKTAYKFTVKAVDKAGNASAASNEVAATTPDQPEGKNFAYSLTGSSKLKSAGGTLPLKGSIKGKIDGSGKFAADLALDKTVGNLTVLGILPATVEVAYVQQGQTTGSLTGTTLTSASKMLVKVPSVKVFGFEVAGGTACQAKSPIDVALKGTDFKIGTGGSLSGTYTLPALDGCGLLTPIVSGFVSGPGNTINVTLKP